MEIISGVYCIENIVNHKKYVGQSVDVYRRWQDHKRKLNGQKHRNEYLQRSWNKYNENNFDFYILEQCDESQLDEVEVYYINLFNCKNPQYGYNIESGGNVNKKLAEETKEKISKSRLGKYCGGENPKAHPVYCPQLDRIFSCLKEIDDEGIACSSGVRDCLNGRSKTAGKHPVTGEALTWEDAFVNKLTIPIKNKQIVPLYCPQLDRLFEGGATQVEKEGYASRTCVSKCALGQRKSAGKHPVTGEPLHWIRSEMIATNNP